MADWASFFAAQVVASAAMAGLIFVSISVNLQRVMSDPRLAYRAFEPLCLLLTVLMVSSLLLVPGHALEVGGVAVIAVGPIGWITATFLPIRAHLRLQNRNNAVFLIRLVLVQAATLPFFATGISMINQDISGIIWVVPGVIFSYLVVFLDMWVLLVEISR